MRHLYTLKRCRHLLKVICKQYKRRYKKLPLNLRKDILALTEEFAVNIQAKDREAAMQNALHLHELFKTHLRKTFLERLFDIAIALGYALIVAIVIRQTWFELYEIPSGSMRPTLKEQDRLVVSKDQFGINIPLMREHLYFNSADVMRNGIVVFTGEGLPINDVNIRYFYIFPGKKQLIKRLIGKPGDILYFYGGQLFGIDKDGNDITQELQNPLLRAIDHVPFIHFDGQAVVPKAPVQGIYTPVLIKQMHETIAELMAKPNGKVDSRLFPLYNNRFINEPLHQYSDYWGIGNFGMARLLTEEEVRTLTDYPLHTAPKGVMYLQIAHHPSTKTAKIARDAYGRIRPVLGLTYSILPLDDAALHILFDNMTTARLVVNNGYASRYEYHRSYYLRTSYSPAYFGVPDGIYECDRGCWYRIGWGGLLFKVPLSHPLYHFDYGAVQLFYDTGIEVSNQYLPRTRETPYFPQRFVYFNNGDLMTMGIVLLKKGHPLLTDFIAREKTSATPFIDRGPPLTASGALDIDFIKQYGLVVPEGHYLVLGDNYAMSADSRDFGFVPEQNLRGVPDLIFWPFGQRLGYPLQPHYIVFTPARIIVLALAALFIALSIWLYKKYAIDHLTLQELKERTLK